MSGWGASTYGDPCRECGWSWSTGTNDARRAVAEVPDRFAELLGEVGPVPRHPDLAWSAPAYAAHVADNLRIWAERLAAAAAGSTTAVHPYDSEGLAMARGYADLPVAGVLWTLRRAVDDWAAAVDLATDAGATLRHPERGDLTVADVVATNAHDAAHHLWDVERIRSLVRHRPPDAPRGLDRGPSSP